MAKFPGTRVLTTLTLIPLPSYDGEILAAEGQEGVRRGALLSHSLLF
jgi:hypothetical protein